MKFFTYKIWEPTEKEIQEIYRSLPKMEQDLLTIGFISYSCSAHELEMKISKVWRQHKIVYERESGQFYLTTFIKDFITNYCPIYFKSIEDVQKFVDKFNKS